MEKGHVVPMEKCLSSYVDGGSKESHKYYLARRTVLEMLRDRGYLVPNSEIDLSLQEFREKYGPIPDEARLRISALHQNDPSDKVLVIFWGANVVKVSGVRAIASQVVDEGTLGRMILVIQSQMTSQAVKSVESFPFKTEIFQIMDLVVNITKHVLKPKHQLLSDEEKESLLKKYSITEKQLPRMSEKDAIARYYGLKKGQVLKVTYNTEITETHVTYRCIW